MESAVAAWNECFRKDYEQLTIDLAMLSETTTLRHACENFGEYRPDLIALCANWHIMRMERDASLYASVSDASQKEGVLGLATTIEKILEDVGEGELEALHQQFLTEFKACSEHALALSQEKERKGLLAEGSLGSLVYFCTGLLKDNELDLLAEILRTDRFFTVVFFAAKSGVRDSESLRADFSQKGTVSRKFKKELKGGDKVLRFFEHRNLVRVVEDLGTRKVGKDTRRKLAQALGNAHNRATLWKTD